MSAKSPESQPRTHSGLLAQIVDSPLSGQIMKLLLVAGALELILVATIGYCLFESGKAAEREFSLLQASSRLATVIKSGRELWEQAGRLRREPSVREYRAYKRNHSLLLADVDAVSDILRKVNANTDIVDDTRKSLLELDNQADEIFRRQQKVDNQGYTYDLWKLQSFKSLDQSVDLIGAVHKIIRAGTQNSARFEQYVFLLMYLFLALNILFIVYGYHLIRSRVTGPIIRLAASCEQILTGKVIPTVASRADDEISALENTFKTMSIALAEDDKRKKNFQALFQNVLARSLQAVDEGLSKVLTLIGEHEIQTQNSTPSSKPLSTSTSTSPSTSASTSTPNATASEGNQLSLQPMVQRCKNGLAHLLAILQSLAHSLESDTEKDLVLVSAEINTLSLIELSVLAIDSLLKDKEITLVQNITPIAVLIDEQLMQRVVTNLLSNAIKFSPDKGQITIQVDDQGSTWQFSVRDQGPGISPTARKKLFTRFGKLENDDGKQREGTGLGLVICKEIIEAHGGAISCDSTPGAGSSFWFRVPKTGKPAATATTISSAQTRAEPQLGIRNKPAQANVNPNVVAQAQASRRGKIAQYYLALLTIFICTHAGIVLFLNGRFQQVHSQASLFSIRRERLLKTQELLSHLIKGRMQIVDAYESGEPARVAKAFRDFETYFALTNGLTLQNSNSDQEAERILKLMSTRERLLERLVETIPKDTEKLTQLDFALIYPPAKKAFYQLEENCFRLMDVDQQSIRDSYAVASDLRKQIAFALFVDFVINIFVFYLAVRHTFKLVQRANLLAEKARAFASGKLPQQSNSTGNSDELAWLDERFCQVAAQLNAMEEKRQSLMAVVNHDLRTPVNSMLLTLDTMIDSVSSTRAQAPSSATQATQATEAIAGSEMSRAATGAQRAMVDTLRSNRKALENIYSRVNNFLLIEKLQHGSYNLKREKLAMDEIIEGLTLAMPARGLIEDNRLVSQMEDPDANWIVMGDRQLLETMLFQLILNACQYSSSRSPAPPVTLTWSAGGDNCMHLDIKNSENNIDAALISQLFERYRSVGDTAIPGIGLPLASKIARLHQGDVQLLSNLPEECVFRVTLPFC